MFPIFLVASGGAVGALLRYLINLFAKTYVTQSFFITLCINIIGSFLIGYIISASYAKDLSGEFIKYFLIIGFLGSFTTFSAFSYEVIDLYNNNNYLLALIYIFLSLFLCVIAAYIGLYINKLWLKILKLKKIQILD